MRLGITKLLKIFNANKENRVFDGGKGGVANYALSFIVYIIEKFKNKRNNKFVHISMEPQKNQQQNKSENIVPTQMEVKHVYDVYDRIAPHFSHTRYKPWPKIQNFLNSLPKDSVVFDVGCGNGKYMGVNPDLIMIGTDRSKGLLETAQNKSNQYELFAADSLKLPLRDQICDAFISIAVIHHFSNQKIRLRAIQEMTRITKIGGKGLIYVWAFDHGQQSVSKKKFTEQDVFVPWNLSFKFEKDLDNIDKTGAKVNMEKRTVVYERYYHVFKQNELRDLIKLHPGLEIIQHYYDKENWACLVQRVK